MRKEHDHAVLLQRHTMQIANKLCAELEGSEMKLSSAEQHISKSCLMLWATFLLCTASSNGTACKPESFPHCIILMSLTNGMEIAPHFIKLEQRLEKAVLLANFEKRFIPAHFPFTGQRIGRMLQHDRHRVNLAETGKSNGGFFFKHIKRTRASCSHRKQSFVDKQSKQGGRNYHFTGSL